MVTDSVVYINAVTAAVVWVWADVKGLVSRLITLMQPQRAITIT